MYADDKQIYVKLKVNAPTAVEKLQHCLCDIQAWMYYSKLNFIPDKIEFMLIGSPKLVQFFPFNILGNDLVLSADVHNLGVIYAADFIHLSILCLPHL